MGQSITSRWEEDYWRLQKRWVCGFKLCRVTTYACCQSHIRGLPWLCRQLYWMVSSSILYGYGIHTGESFVRDTPATKGSNSLWDYTIGRVCHLVSLNRTKDAQRFSDLRRYWLQPCEVIRSASCAGLRVGVKYDSCERFSLASHSWLGLGEIRGLAEFRTHVPSLTTQLNSTAKPSANICGNIYQIQSTFIHMSSAIRFVTHNSCSRVGSVYLQCRVKPGASKQREGIVSISETTIEICVCAQAQKGEANKAVLNIISQVSDLSLFKGLGTLVAE